MFKSAKSRFIAGAAVIASFTAPAAFAVDGASAAAMDSILAEAQALLAKGWLIAVPVVVGFIGMKLFKKVANKST